MLYAPSAHDSYPGTQKRRISGKDDFAVSRVSSTCPNVGFRAAAAAAPPQAEVTHSWHLPGPHPTSCKVGTSGWGVRTPCEAVCTLRRTSMASQVLLGFRVYKLYYSHFHEQMVLQNCSNFQPSSLPFFKRFAFSIHNENTRRRRRKGFNSLVNIFLPCKLIWRFPMSVRLGMLEHLSIIQERWRLKT